MCGPTPFLLPVGYIGPRGAVTDPPASGLPVSGIHQLRSQTELLQSLVANHHDDGGGRGGNDASRQPFGHPPAALLPDQLPERLHDRRPSFNLSRTDIQVTRTTRQISYFLMTGGPTWTLARTTSMGLVTVEAVAAARGPAMACRRR